MSKEKSANSSVILLSGGIDSATTLAIARNRGDRVFAITFDYGQRHRFELSAAKAVAGAMKVEKHLLFPINLRTIGGSALTADVDVPKDRDLVLLETEIPVTYVPARNTIFLSIALAWAESLGVRKIMIGANAVDYSGYPDCRPAFIEAFRHMANLATRIGVEDGGIVIDAPLIDLSKAQIIREGVRLGVDYSMTFSCYDPTAEGQSCGHCDSCQIRKSGFREAGIPDPTKYTS